MTRRRLGAASCSHGVVYHTMLSWQDVVLTRCRFDTVSSSHDVSLSRRRVDTTPFLKRHCIGTAPCQHGFVPKNDVVSRRRRVGQHRVKMTPYQDDTVSRRRRANSATCQSGVVPRRRCANTMSCLYGDVSRRCRGKTTPCQNDVVST